MNLFKDFFSKRRLCYETHQIFNEILQSNFFYSICFDIVAFFFVKDKTLFISAKKKKLYHTGLALCENSILTLRKVITKYC